MLFENSAFLLAIQGCVFRRFAISNPMPTIRKRKAVTAIESANSFWSIAILAAVAIMRIMHNAMGSAPGRLLVKNCTISEYASQDSRPCTISIEKIDLNYLILTFASFQSSSSYFLYFHFLIKECRCK
jgi:hypothetical protein